VKSTSDKTKKTRALLFFLLLLLLLLKFYSYLSTKQRKITNWKLQINLESAVIRMTTQTELIKLVINN